MYLMSLLMSLLTAHFNTVFDFKKESSLEDWYIVNDDVMGGISTSQLVYVEEGYASFSGVVSLENNGGFASVRYYTNGSQVQQKRKAVLKVKGDGKRYQFRIKTNSQDWYSYITYFETNGEWQEITIDLDELYPTFRGGKLDAGNFADDSFEEFSILIANYKEEEFEILIESLKLY